MPYLIVSIALLFGFAVLCWLRAGALEDRARSREWHRDLYNAMLKKTDRGLIRSWDTITSEKWEGTADELRLHIRNLMERMEE